MADSIPDHVAREVLRHYPAVESSAVLHGLGNRGGFSGACLWRVEQAAAVFCLRAWPPQALARPRLGWIHQLMSTSRSAGLNFVPDVLRSEFGTTWIEYAARLWELQSWMPGQADFHHQPTRQKMAAACTALALLHNAWMSVAPSRRPCPAIQRRLQSMGEWLALSKHAHLPHLSDSDSKVLPWAGRAWKVLGSWAGEVVPSLLPLADRPVPLQPCLCDIWHDHVFFADAIVTGVIDYGGVKIDHIAVDLARLLGSTAADDPALFAEGMNAYARVRSLSLEEQLLVRLLDRTGTIVGLANWLKWLFYERRVFENYALVAQRMQKLVERIERWNPGSLGE